MKKTKKDKVLDAMLHHENKIEYLFGGPDIDETEDDACGFQIYQEKFNAQRLNDDIKFYIKVSHLWNAKEYLSGLIQGLPNLEEGEKEKFYAEILARIDILKEILRTQREFENRLIVMSTMLENDLGILKISERTVASLRVSLRKILSIIDKSTADKKWLQKERLRIRINGLLERTTQLLRCEEEEETYLKYLGFFNEHLLLQMKALGYNYEQWFIDFEEEQ